MRNRCLAIVLLIRQRDVHDLAGLGQTHRPSEFRFQFPLHLVVPQEGRRIVARHIEGVIEPLVAPNVGGVQDRFGDLEQTCGRVGMRAHPDRAPEFATGLRQEGGEQIGVVQLVRHAGKDG